VFRNQFKGTFTNNKIYNDFANNIFQGFYNNTALNEVLRNQFNGYASDNILSGSFNDNIVGDYFQNNTFLGYTANNQIGTYFEDNTIGDSFGYGAGYSRANKIGHYFQDNNIGEYFYSNTISDNFNGNTVGNYFQQNTVFANNININDFTSLYGNIVSYSIVNPNVSGSDGVYPLIETTTNGQGIDATFDVTITSGSASVVIANVGKLYSTEDTLKQVYSKSTVIDNTVKPINTEDKIPSKPIEKVDNSEVEDIRKNILSLLSDKKVVKKIDKDLIDQKRQNSRDVVIPYTIQPVKKTSRTSGINTKRGGGFNF
jgi:hypothetical protein